MLPLRPAEEDQRGELFGGLARGDRRGLRGAAQLHDEIGGQLAEVRYSPLVLPDVSSRLLSMLQGFPFRPRATLRNGLRLISVDATSMNVTEVFEVRLKTSGRTRGL
jgi:hypothetical protein